MSDCLHHMQYNKIKNSKQKKHISILYMLDKTNITNKYSFLVSLVSVLCKGNMPANEDRIE